MEGALRVQDIIGLVLAILIVAILISIILILRESARERKMWKEEQEEFPEKPKLSQYFTSRGRTKPRRQSGVDQQTLLEDIEKRKKWQTLPREEKKEEPLAKDLTPPEEETVPPLEVGQQFSEKEKIPIEEPIKKREPKRVILEQALEKLRNFNLDIANIPLVLDEESVHFSPMLWEVKEEVSQGKELGDIVIHTVFQSLPGYSGEEVIELFRSGDVSVVDRLEARVRTAEGRSFLVASLELDRFRIPQLDRLLQQGFISEDEYQLVRAFKFVDRNTKKEFARTVYSRIVGEEG